METFVLAKGFVPNPRFQQQRQRTLRELDIKTIDEPIAQMVAGLNRLPYCFTLQSCYGHFLHGEQWDEHNLDPLPRLEEAAQVEYRIAYLALCVQETDPGRDLLAKLEGLTGIDPGNVQFGCATWFWERQVNSYVVQVEPDRFKFQDRCTIPYREAFRVERVRDQFYGKLGIMLANLK